MHRLDWGIHFYKKTNSPHVKARRALSVGTGVASGCDREAAVSCGLSTSRPAG